LRTIYNINLKNNHPQPLLGKEGEYKEFRDISPFIFKRFIKKYLSELNIDEKFLDRDLNV